MPTITLPIHSPPPAFLAFPASIPSRNVHKLSTVTASWRMSMDSGPFQTKKREELSLHVQHPAAFDSKWDTLRLPDLRFDRLQIPEKDLIDENKLEFGKFVAREALIDEEYWTAAFLRAASQWEGREKDRYSESLRMKYVEQEFNAIRRRRSGPYGQKSKCIITVRKQDPKVKCTVLKSVVGTLDLSIRCFLPGESFPGERGKAPRFCSLDGEGGDRYSYVANLVVSKAERHQGIATNMMQFAVETAKSNGVEHLYVHVDRKNKLAQHLYEKMGFEMIEEASEGLVEDKTYLLRYSL